MAPIRAYHRPDTVGEALGLLARPDVASAVLAGGTVLNAGTGLVEEVVDLQALGFGGIEWRAPHLVYGATATLRDVVDHEMTPPVLRDLARVEAPNTIRNAATVGGTIAASDPESVFLAGLLAFDASLEMTGPSGSSEVSVEAVVSDPGLLAGHIITSVAVGIDRQGAFAATGRTPADTPIVLVVGCRSASGESRFAATGLADRPIVIDPDSVDRLDPPGDFRGTSEYRRSLAQRLTGRVVVRLGDGSDS